MAARASSSIRSVSRLIDANLNRAMEGLRVCEDILRFHRNHPRLARQTRAVRHAVGAAAARLPISHVELLRARDSRHDIGRRAPTTSEPSLERVLLINFQRAKESLRVLEECARVMAPGLSRVFQAIRFRIYDLERDTLLNLAPVRHH